MATAMSNVSEIDEHFLQCPICLERFENPKILPKCGHSACEKCVVEIVAKNLGLLQCPMCRADNTPMIPRNGVSGLPDNHILKSLKHFVQVAKNSPSDGRSGDVDLGEACEIDGNVAVAYCTVCQQFLCHQCRGAHNRISATKDHRVVSIQDFLISPLEILQSTTNCPVHVGKQVTMYCETCEVPVCDQCSETMHQDETHKHIHLKTAAQERKTAMIALNERVQENAPKLKSALENFEEQRTDCYRERGRLYTEIQECAQDLIDAVRIEEEKLLKDVQKTSAEDIEDLDKKIENFGKMVKKSQNSAAEVNEMFEIQNDVAFLFLEKQERVHFENLATAEFETRKSTKTKFTVNSNLLNRVEKKGIGKLSVKK
ncbi:tripartite motif-containing protein 3-like [Ptychodera flava]|uniref:tripartite motif-containing protein 3-like n=1 Tax=Ptychodera flava TaxID=63121 RepID=UPI00396A9FAE